MSSHKILEEIDLIYRDGLAYDGGTNDLMTGQVSKRDLNGRIRELLTYKNGERSGLFEQFDSKGNQKLLGNYKDGLKEGIWKEFDENNKLIERWTFDKGNLMDGRFRDFHLNGNLKSTGKFKNGLKEGLWKEFDENNNLVIRQKFSKGKLIDGIVREFHKNGRLKVTGSFEGGKKTGVWIELDDKGNYKGVFRYHDESYKYFYIEDTEFWEYYTEGEKLPGALPGSQRGKLKQRGQYKNGFETGVWNTYYKSGGIETATNYISGRRDGKFFRFYATGEIKETGFFKSNNRSGSWYKYEKDGPKSWEERKWSRSNYYGDNNDGPKSWEERKWYRSNYYGDNNDDLDFFGSEADESFIDDWISDRQLSQRIEDIETERLEEFRDNEHLCPICGGICDEKCQIDTDPWEDLPV